MSASHNTNNSPHTHSPSASHVGHFKQEQSSVSKEAISFESKVIGGYILGSTLGSGSCAVVKLGTHCNTGKKVAVKIVKPTTLREQKEVIREVEALQMLKQHPHIIRLLRVIREDGYTCLILELGTEGDLFEHVLQNGKLPEVQARRIFRQLVSAVQYCHAHLVIHRDLKPENVLIDASGSIKISDFGLSNILRPGKLCSTFCGSPVYCPPEVVLQRQYNGFLVDVWSLGVILYVMVTGGMPWRLEKNIVKNMDDLIAANYVIPECLGISPECKSLIKMMLTDSKDRASIYTIASHPWINIGFDGPPDTHLKLQSLVEKTNINEDIIQQMVSLGIDSRQAELDIQTKPSSIALTTYHLLLEKHTSAARLENVSINIDDGASSPNQALSVHLFRQRATTFPQNDKSTPLPPISTQDNTSQINPKLHPKEQTINNSDSILQHLFIYFEKLKKFRKITKKDSISKHKSPVHSPILQKRHV